MREVTAALEVISNETPPMRLSREWLPPKVLLSPADSCGLRSGVIALSPLSAGGCALASGSFGPS